MPDRLAARDAIARGISGRLPGRRAAADRPADAAAAVAAGALHAPLRSGADLQLGRVRRGDGAASVRRSPPLIHHEDGFNEDEARAAEPAPQPLSPARAWRRRTAWSCRPRGSSGSRAILGHASPVAHSQRRRRSRDFAGPPEPGAIPGFERQADEVVIGTVAGLRAVKNLPRLVRAFAAHAATSRRGWSSSARGRKASGSRPRRAARGVAARLLMPGFLERSRALDRPFRHLRSCPPTASNSPSPWSRRWRRGCRRWRPRSATSPSSSPRTTGR